ncbi:hypothetical protein NPIL_526241 [Nephila pilipes]|uniref:Uncharacterized protein n=1 Tax=Nephila pilipes TaxID=299642 RepID=A0A8X6U8N0_NEPPI|nr:hypothetical protein NPIL_526241 [Nephila pilipes]
MQTLFYRFHDDPASAHNGLSCIVTTFIASQSPWQNLRNSLLYQMKRPTKVDPFWHVSWRIGNAKGRTHFLYATLYVFFSHLDGNTTERKSEKMVQRYQCVVRAVAMFVEMLFSRLNEVLHWPNELSDISGTHNSNIERNGKQMRISQIITHYEENIRNLTCECAAWLQARYEDSLYLEAREHVY